MKTLLKLFRRRKQKLDPRIFQPDSWLTKQVNEAILKEQYNREQHSRG